MLCSLRYAEDRGKKAQQQVNRLQQTLQARSEEIDKLNMVVRNIAEQCQLPADRLQWMMSEAWKQQQHAQQSLLQQCDQLNASVHERDMLISQLEHQISELENRKSEAETYSRIKGKNMSTEKIESLAAKLDNAQMVCIKILEYTVIHTSVTCPIQLMFRLWGLYLCNGSVFLFQCIDRMKEDIEGYQREIHTKTEELIRKDASIKGFQEILRKEQQSHQEKLLALQGDHSTQ